MHGIEVVDDVRRRIPGDFFRIQYALSGPEGMQHQFRRRRVEEVPARWPLGLNAQAVDQHEFFGWNRDDLGKRADLKLGQRRELSGSFEAVGGLTPEVLCSDPVVKVCGCQGIDLLGHVDQMQIFVEQ